MDKYELLGKIHDAIATAEDYADYAFEYGDLEAAEYWTGYLAGMQEAARRINETLPPSS